MDAVIGAAAAGAVVGAVLMAAVYLYKWLARSAKRVATSDTVAKAKSSAASAIAASSGSITKAAKTSAAIVRKASRQNPNDRYEALLKLKHLLDAGALTEDEYEAEKRKLLDD
jgi:hypothetical protein